MKNKTKYLSATNLSSAKYACLKFINVLLLTSHIL